MNELIAIIDDEPDILQLVVLQLKKNGFRTAGFAGANGFYNFLNEKSPDLVILDLMLPDIDGVEICKQLKSDPKTAKIPIIMLTARSEEFDKVLGLEIGADDYVTKPFSSRELIARVKAVLRRSQPTSGENILKIADGLIIDLEKYIVLANGKPITLTATEFNLLKILAQKPGHVFSRENLLDQLWGEDKIVVNRTIDVHIKNLREKLGEYGRLIRNLRGVGYKLEI
ncbi:MAG TPA: response regulator [Candidatus Marinimicrobia bacterium]|nr:response regulator [Candidatus Neomarinimicrobiota bacterium]HRS52042.1 response regulator [Candidatus Neomarinimicrobiota bacterium]HRU91644.1 response regulator [Candidatus Neomarinimicrobiota bacterium]